MDFFFSSFFRFARFEMRGKEKCTAPVLAFIVLGLAGFLVRGKHYLT